MPGNLLSLGVHYERLVRLRYLGHNLEVPEGEFVIGRSSRCQLSIDDPLISRQHAVLTIRGGQATVEDLSSRNGITVNGKRISGVTPLLDGDSITVGTQLMTIHEAPHRRALGDVLRLAVDLDSHFFSIAAPASIAAISARKRRAPVT